jgi:DNA-directed RNA polymerase II subunit RPB1
MVGTVGASSIGAPCTQMTLNTFHTAGVGTHSVTRGVPRLKELIDLSKHIRTPSMHVFFESPYDVSSTLCTSMCESIRHTLLHELVLSSSVVTELNSEDAEFVQMHEMLMTADELSDVFPDAFIRFCLDRETMVRRQLHVHLVGKAFVRFLGTSGVVSWSDVNCVNWVVVVKLRCLDVQTVVDSVPDQYATDLKHKALYMIHDYLMDNVTVHGVYGVSGMVPCRTSMSVVEPSTGGLVNVQRWSADSEGSNLWDVLVLPGVDATRTCTNDVFETLEVFGLEAAIHVLLSEIRAVLSYDGAYINDRHLQLLVDVMTHSGNLSPVTRHSMVKLGATVFTRASFEQTQDVLTWAACLGTSNSTNGVTENIMLGTPIAGGTGAMDIRSSVQLPEVTPLRIAALPTVRTMPTPVPPLLKRKAAGGPVAALETGKKRRAVGASGQSSRLPSSASYSHPTTTAVCPRDTTVTVPWGSGKTVRTLVLESPQLLSKPRMFFPQTP